MNQYVALLVAIAIGAAILFSGSLTKIPPSTNPPQIAIPVTAVPHSDKNLQLQTFPFITSQPSQAKCALEGAKENCECQHVPYNADVPEVVCSKTNHCELWQICEQGGWNSIIFNIQTLGGLSIAPNAYRLDCPWLQNLLADGKEYCVAKPVIYLYPQTPTYVDVTIETTGSIFTSIPHYPTGGWKSVYAEPDGALTYQNKKYSELFYESDVKTIQKPANGLIFKNDDLESGLSDTLLRLGLNASEKAEFLDYWIPNLKKLNSPYILFSLIDSSEKQKIDKVNIMPEPATRIEILAYFRPLDKPIDIPKLQLPDKPPARLGFTMVEWGGTIDASPTN